MEGRCACGEVAYRLTGEPLIVHACHCTWCQRETGSAFAINLWIETLLVDVTKGAPEPVHTPSASGKGQVIYRCPTCQVALFSEYATGPMFRFLRAGTLDDPAAVSPDVHVYTATKLPWVSLPDGVPAFEEYYRRSEVWPETSVARFKSARAATG